MDMDLTSGSFLLQLISLVTALVAVALSLSLGAVLRDGRTRSETNVAIQAIDVFFFWIHFMLDMVATAAAVAFFLSVSDGLLRTVAVTTQAVIAMYVYGYLQTRGNSNLARWRAGLYGLIYIIRSPLYRLPGGPWRYAKYVRRMIFERSSIQLIYVTIGLGFVAWNDRKGLPRWEKTYAVCVLSIIAAFLSTHLPGPNLLYTDKWDLITTEGMLLEREQRVNKFSLQRFFTIWKSTQPQYAHLADEQSIALAGASLIPFSS
eukprot:TRINITY_DN68033_c0_g1_i1.p1 TRINITY_DN68033_c0_g1~~TRINITY_DN68033_c0_g1_i1.p1  ORF type:complete len:275 (-),score=27.44 TRINITY_DN68033_c0_g1_i1:119-901(-)